MTYAVYPKAKQRMLTTGLNLLAGTVKAQLIDLSAYTFSGAHEFLSDIPAGARIGSPVTLANKTVDLGVFDADDLAYTLSAGLPAIGALALFVDTGTESTSWLVLFQDGKLQITAAAAASSGATSISVDRLAAAIAAGSALTKVSGTGPSSITVAAAASAGARSMTVSALSAPLGAEDVYTAPVAGSGLPTAAGATSGTVTWPNGANKIFAV